MLRTSTVEPPTPTPVTLVDPSLLSTALVEQLEGIPVGQHVVLVLHEDHFTRELATFLTTQPQANYRIAAIRFSPGQIEAQGEIRVFGVWVSTTVWGSLDAQDCQAQATITDFSIGGLLTPVLVREEARKLIHGQLEEVMDNLFETLPVCLESVEVLDGVAILNGTKQ